MIDKNEDAFLGLDAAKKPIYDGQLTSLNADFPIVSASKELCRILPAIRSFCPKAQDINGLPPNGPRELLFPL